MTRSLMVPTVRAKPKSHTCQGRGASHGRGRKRTRATKLSVARGTHLHETVPVKQKVGRLDVAVHEPGRVHVLERTEQLPDDVLLVHLFQDLCSDRGVQVCVHVVKDHVQIAVIVRLEHMQQPDNILVRMQHAANLHLAVRALRVRRVLEGVEALLQSHLLLGLAVCGLPDDAVRALAQLPRDVVPT